MQQELTHGGATAAKIKIWAPGLFDQEDKT